MAEKQPKKKESKVGAIVVVKDGNLKKRIVFDENTTANDLTMAVSYLEIAKNELLGLLVKMSKRE